MNRLLHWWLAPAALLFQALPGLFIYAIPRLAFGDYKMTMPELFVWPFSMTGLAFFALTGLGLASSASYLLLTRAHWAAAGLMITVFCVPAWALSVFYLHAVLVFLGWA